MQTRLPFFTLLLLISFASVNAVLFTPALPNIALFFGITEDKAQLTLSWFLVGYALGQLLYGPIANRFGRKPALYTGISLQIISSLLCVLSGYLHFYGLLIGARFLLALGSGVGLKMTFTLVNECYSPQIARQKISYLMLAFAITPGLGVALGGLLNTYWGWTSCFYAGFIYGLIMLILIIQLPETHKKLTLNALNINHLFQAYGSQFRNIRLIFCGFLMGSTTSFIYIFAAIAPFIAMNLFGMSSYEYGMANCLPPIGLIVGSLASARLSQEYSLHSMIQTGIWTVIMGVVLMFVMMLANISLIFSLFLPMMIVYCGLCFIMANTSVLAMEGVDDKAHGAAVMSFINVGFATLMVFGIAFFSINVYLLPGVFILLCFIMLGILNKAAPQKPSVSLE
jgi:MFS family permease